MRIRLAFLVVSGVAIISTGCTVAWNAANTLVVEPAHFPNYLEQCLLRARTCKLAEDAWKEVLLEGQPYSKDYAKGFKGGFADFLQNGGTGEPPPLPPRLYWDVASPPGREAAQEWFAGFRQGAARAKRSGLRELIVVPASIPGLMTPVHADRGDASGAEWIAPPNPQPADPPLPPPPKKLD